MEADADTIVDEILKKPFPPLAMADLETFFFLKRKLPAEHTARRRIVEFERRARLQIPTEEIRDIREYLKVLETRSWTTVIDTLLLSYWKARIPLFSPTEEEMDIFHKFIEEHSTPLLTPNEDYLNQTADMARGIRLEAENSTPAEQPKEAPAPAPSAPVSESIEVSPTPLTPSTTPELVAEPKGRVRVQQPAVDSTAIAIMDGLREYQVFSAVLDKSYWDENTTSSTALDIIAVYLKGQKILYIEAKTYCETRLTFLMLPAILISAACTVLSTAVKGFDWGATLVSSLTAANTFILAVVNFLKLDAKAEAHKTASYQFDKLQTICEFNSGKVLFFDKKDTVTIVDDIEKRVNEIKDNNQFIIPEAIRYRFPTIYRTNVFSEVKAIENLENKVKNRLNEILVEMQRVSKSELEATEKELRLQALEQEKKVKMEEYLGLRDKYLQLDDDFNTEIEENIKRGKRCNPCSWLKV
jgi:hypothetical protein